MLNANFHVKYELLRFDSIKKIYIHKSNHMLYCKTFHNSSWIDDLLKGNTTLNPFLETENLVYLIFIILLIKRGLAVGLRV